MMLIGLLFLAQTSGVPAATPAQAPAPANTDQKVVCHSEYVLDSRIMQRICHTKAEWDQIEHDTQQSFKDNMGKHNDPGNSPE
jgi:hypothetical protein